VLLEAGEKIRQETRHWDETDGRTHTLRSKEDADDYRYFLEPDLVPLNPDQAWIDAVRAALPMLPRERRLRLSQATGAPADGEAIMVVVERGQDDYVMAVGDAGADVARALVHVKEAFAEQGASPTVPASDLAQMIIMETGGKLTSTQAKTVLAEIVANGGGDAEAIVDQVIAEQAEAWSKYCGGEQKAMGALVGAIMKASQGKADGKAVTALLLAKKG
jgi:aspartyl-tRNA(Asn)/glutamyl-tRNA(Gln) amidotransferase subunit B